MTYETFSNDVITFVGGSYQVISFNIYNLGGDRVISPIIDNVVWDMALYGENESLLHKTMNDKEITVDKGTINIVLKGKDTTSFSGLFTHQLEITDANNENFIVDLGQIVIKKKIS